MNFRFSPVAPAIRSVQPVSAFQPRLRADSVRPYIGILGVLLGSIMSTLGSRVTSFGIADLRGGLGLGFDEGAWMTTAFGVGQMLIGVACPYLGAVFGVRRVLLLGIGLFFIASLLGPLSPNLAAFLLAQFLAGVGTGTFIPLTLSFILRSLPARLVIYGIAVFATNSELSQNIGASLEGWYTEYLSWRWIDWQYCFGLPVMFACVWYGIPREETNTALARDLDWPGVTYAGLGFGALYGAIDQGNRLDWTNNGVINGLLAAGTIVTLVFVARESWTAKPFLNIRLLLTRNLMISLLLLVCLRFIILSTAYIIPNYLQSVQNFRELQVGAVLLWIALPQLIIVLPLGALMKRADGRWILALGAALIGIACLMASNLTGAWATDEFMASQILQALGQSLALTALIVVTVGFTNPADALTIGALLQISRLFGGEIGTAFMQTYVRTREQVHSNLIGLHIDGPTGLTAERLSFYRNALSTHGTDVVAATARAAHLLAAAVARQAAVLSFIDGFLAAAAGAYLCVLLTAFFPRPLQQRRDGFGRTLAVRLLGYARAAVRVPRSLRR